MMSSKILAQILAALLVLITPVMADSGSVLLVSDIHFSPFADPEILPKLRRAPVEQWRHVFADSSKQKPAVFGANTNHPLFASWLEAAVRVAPSPDYILIPGDFVTHGFNQAFARLSTDPSAKGVEEFRNKTIAFLIHEIRRRYPATPIVPVLGNNDSHRDNYAIAPGGRFLKHHAKAWKSLFRNRHSPNRHSPNRHSPNRHSANRHSARRFMRTFPTGGYFSVPSPGGKHDLLVLNTVLWSTQYPRQDAAGADHDQMQWLAGQLRSASSEGRKVWIIGHIPPGIGTYSSLKGAQGNLPTQAVPFWDKPFNQRFLDLIEHHADAVVAVIASHIHRDSFALLGHRAGGGPAAAVMRIVPSLTPVYNNNPAFQVLHFDRRRATLLNLETWYLDLSSENPSWRREYSFNQAFGTSKMDEPALTELYYQLLHDPEKQSRFIRFYSVSSPRGEIRECNWPAYWTGLGQMYPEGYLRWLGAVSSDTGCEPE